MTAETALGAIRATYADLDSWQARGRKIELPQPGSELALDDQIYPWHSISEVARVSLLSAGEHLRLARTSLEAGQVYPSAHFTALRGALVGACQAVWILAAGDRSSRRERGLAILDQMYTELARYYREIAMYYAGLETTAVTDAERQELSNQSQWCENRHQHVESIRHAKNKLNQTEIITWALNHSFQDEKRRGAGRLLWRQMSADAHVLGWSVAQRAIAVTSDRRTGIGVFQSGGDLQHVAEPFVATYRVLKGGWSLFDRLCEAPG